MVHTCTLPCPFTFESAKLLNQFNKNIVVLRMVHVPYAHIWFLPQVIQIFIRYVHVRIYIYIHIVYMCQLNVNEVQCIMYNIICNILLVHLTMNS